jgi:chaperonin GroES
VPKYRAHNERLSHDQLYNLPIFWRNPRRTFSEISPAPRPRRHRAYRCRVEDRRRHHYSGHRKGEAAEGKVVAVGPGGRDDGGKLIPIDVEVGNRILFGKWSGTEVKIDGVEYLIMKESDIMGVVEAETRNEAKKKAA